MEESAARFWRLKGRWTAFRHNAGWWASYFLSASFVVSALFACVFLLLRHAGATSEKWWYGYASLLLIVGGIAWVRSRPRFLTAESGLVRLEHRLRLHNRLTAATAGVGSFPAPRPVDDGLRWRWPRIAVLLGGAAALVGAAAWMPVKTGRGEHYTIAQPPAWTDVAAWADELQKSNAVKPEAIEKLREQLGELSRQPENEWYGQSSLEAGDALHEQTAQSIEALARNLQIASNALTSAQQLGESGSAADRKELARQLGSAIEGLQMGNLPLKSDLMGSLKNVDPSKLRQLDPLQLKELRERMAEAGKACAKCRGVSGLPVFGEASGEEPGRGGIDRGPGAARLGLNKTPTDLQTKTTEGLAGADLSRALPGEVLGMQSSEPQPDTAASAATGPAGAIISAGSGGKAVWRNDLTPQERQVLERFFK